MRKENVRTSYLLHLSTTADSKISDQPWVKFQSAGWVNIQSAPTNLPQNAATTIIYLFLSAAYFAVWLIPAFKGNNWKEQSLRKMGYVQIHTNEGVSINEIADAPESLIGATWHGNSSTVSKLIRDGADVNATNASGYTALDVASARGDTSTVLLLLSHGARIRGGSVELNAE